MHIHRDRKGKGKDGQDRTYVSVVHSTWEATVLYPCRQDTRVCGNRV